MRTTVQAYREIVRWFVKAAAEEDQCRPITTEQMLCEEVTAIYGIDLSGKSFVRKLLPFTASIYQVRKDENFTDL
jgi:hypothetical protein